MATTAGSYVVTILLLVSALAGALTLTTATFRQTEAQTFSRSVTCVPAYQTVYVPIYRTLFQTLTHTAYSTSYSLTYSAYSTSYPVTFYSRTTTSLTQFINWTVSPVGVFGTFPSSTFGGYSDLALLSVGVLAGVGVAIGVARGLNWLNPQPEPPRPAKGILFCKKCGADFSVGQKFCRDCGTALK